MRHHRKFFAYLAISLLSIAFTALVIYDLIMMINLGISSNYLRVFLEFFPELIASAVGLFILARVYVKDTKRMAYVIYKRKKRFVRFKNIIKPLTLCLLFIAIASLTSSATHLGIIKKIDDTSVDKIVSIVFNVVLVLLISVSLIVDFEKNMNLKKALILIATIFYLLVFFFDLYNGYFDMYRIIIGIFLVLGEIFYLLYSLSCTNVTIGQIE